MQLLKSISVSLMGRQNGISWDISPKNEVSSFTHTHVIPTFMTFFLQWKMQEDIFRRIFLFFDHTMKVIVVQNNTDWTPLTVTVLLKHFCGKLEK